MTKLTERDNNLKPVQPCKTESGVHSWLPTTGKGLQCYSCPMCQQRIYWSEINKLWVKVTPKGGARNNPNNKGGE